jgi:uncharacterized protein
MSYDGVRSFSKDDVRRALLAAQGMSKPSGPLPVKGDVLAAIHNMGQLQIDTISVVARSPYFVLWSRLGNYDPRWLEELLEEGKIYESWSHEACFLPTTDLAYSRTRIAGPALWRKDLIEFLEEHRTEADKLLGFIGENGPVRSSDFVNPVGTRGGWWDWKHEKLLLESLFASGELMVVRREKFQRVYDLTERVHPDAKHLPLPTPDEMAGAYILKTVRALGIAHRSWLADYYRMRNYEFQHVLPSLVSSGQLLETSIEGIPGPAFVHPAMIEPIEAALSTCHDEPFTTLLSPFDPVVWDRKRSEMLFDFSYRIECYTPAHKRQYGYFSLPILHDNALVGRLDAKAHRKNQIFEVRSLHLEPGIKPTESLVHGLASALIDCAEWHKTSKVVVEQSNPKGFRRNVSAEIKRQLKASR